MSFFLFMRKNSSSISRSPCCSPFSPCFQGEKGERRLPQCVIEDNKLFTIDNRGRFFQLLEIKASKLQNEQIEEFLNSHKNLR